MSRYQKILVVCTGNICRSPVAEAILKQAWPDREIQSVGLAAVIGHKADSLSSAIAAADGYDLSDHISRQIKNEHVQWADLILVMSQEQRNQLAQRSPEAMGKTVLLGHWLQGPGTRSTNGMDIPDPYKKSRDVFEYVHKTIRQAAELWIQKI